MIFKELEHEYWEGSVEYLPTSDWTKKFYKPFDSKTIAKAIARKNKEDYQPILNKWDAKRDYSCDYGNAIHRAVEYWINYREFPDHPHLRKAVEAFIKVLNKLYPGKIIKKLVAEMIAHDDENLIAGTIDVPVGLGNNVIDVIDLKTNGIFDKPGRNRMLAPFQMLKDSNLNKYRLQVSMYHHLLKCMGYKPRNGYLVHWNGSTFKIVKVKILDLTKALTIKK